MDEGFGGDMEKLWLAAILVTKAGQKTSVLGVSRMVIRAKIFGSGRSWVVFY